MKPKKAKYRSLGISIVLTLIGLILSLAYFKSIPIATCLQKLGFPLARLTLLISAGLLAGQLIEALGWTRHAAIVARPFFRFSNLGNQCSAAFTTAFISGTTANAMLLEFYETGKINRMQLFLCNYINQFPGFFLHLPTTVFIVLPLTGSAGALYFILTFLALVFRTFLFLVFGRLFLAPLESSHVESNHLEKSPKKEAAQFISLLKAVLKKLPVRIVNIFIWILPIYTLVFVLNLNGFFDYLNHVLADSLTLSIMPVESLSVVILSFAAEFTSGFAAAGALMHAGVITIKQTVIALLLGNVLAFPIRALRHQLPAYMGIFSPQMGIQLLLSGQFFRISSIIFVGTLYYIMA